MDDREQDGEGRRRKQKNENTMRRDEEEEWKKENIGMRKRGARILSRR